MRITAKTGVLFSTRAASPFFESSSNPVVNLFSAKYSTLSYIAASVGLEKYLFKCFLGNVSLAAGYQAAHSDGLLHNQFDHGPVATVQVYFSKLALPGMGLGMAYNVNKNVFQYALNMGISF